MKDEIKENVEPTLEYLKICVEDDISFETTNCKALLDYITNLQEENEKLKDYYNDNVNNYEELLEKYSTIQILYNSSKLKNEKAIEYILNNKLYCFKYDDEELFEITTDKKAKDELLNILQGGFNE